MTLQRQVSFWIVALARRRSLLLAVLPRASCCRSSPASRSPICSIPLADRLQRVGLGRLGRQPHHPDPVRPHLHRRPDGARAAASASSSASSSTGCPSYVARLQQLAVEQGGPLDRAARRGRLRSRTCSNRSATSSRRGSPGSAPSCRASGPADRRFSASSPCSSSRPSSPSTCWSTGTGWSRTVDSWMPMKHRDTIRALARDIDRAIAGFVRGQALVCLILGTFYAVAPRRCSA